MQYHVNGKLINEVPKFLTSVPSETMHAIQIENLFDATQTSYFEVRKPTQEEYEVQNILKIELIVEAPP